ncbi:AAA family ATPase [Candidatus Woesearchaeota archaeon]|nr:AAA family ATPase [Candidatus Woesearchaeota archaeon]
MRAQVKPWTQKHMPQKVKEVVGQDKAIVELKKFVVNFRKERKKARLLYGPTGSGKTCAVYALAGEMGLEVVEINASDSRTAGSISTTVGNAS